jgi:hypothetical protein
MSEKDQEQPRQSKCPICGKQVASDQKSYPFCSERCRTIDLARWAQGKYVISRPVEQSDQEET